MAEAIKAHDLQCCSPDATGAAAAVIVALGWRRCCRAVRRRRSEPCDVRPHRLSTACDPTPYSVVLPSKCSLSAPRRHGCGGNSVPMREAQSLASAKPDVQARLKTAGTTNSPRAVDVPPCASCPRASPAKAYRIWFDPKQAKQPVAGPILRSQRHLLGR